MKLIFAPVSIVFGLVAGVVGRRGFEAAWGLVDEADPPDPRHRRVEWPKLFAALAIEGAIFRLVKGLVEHGSRSSFARVTGRWPGEEAPEAD
jgi:hypothetical protein